MVSVRAKWASMEMDGIGEFEDGSAAMDHLVDYVDRACSVCWMMVLQDPPLRFWPNQWSALRDEEENVGGGTERVRFDEKRHKRVIGSDRRSHYVLYFVWPALSNGTDLCGNGKMDVVVRDKWPQMRRTKGSRHSKTTKGTKERERNVLSVVQAITDQQAQLPVQHNRAPDMSQFQYSNTDDEPWPCLNKQCAVYIDNEHEMITNGRRQRTCPGCGTTRWSPSAQPQDVFVD